MKLFFFQIVVVSLLLGKFECNIGFMNLDHSSTVDLGRCKQLNSMYSCVCRLFCEFRYENSPFLIPT